MGGASAETGLPISFHIGGGVSTIPINPNGWAHLAFSTVVAMQLCEPLATMIFCGALERHPGMRLVMAEAGLGWLPYFVHRMDASSAKRPGVAKDYQLRSVPSDIFRQQVYITFEEEAARRRPTSSCWVPTISCGPATSRMPTARSPSRGRRSWHRSNR